MDEYRGFYIDSGEYRTSDEWRFYCGEGLSYADYGSVQGYLFFDNLEAGNGFGCIFPDNSRYRSVAMEQAYDVIYVSNWRYI